MVENKIPTAQMVKGRVKWSSWSWIAVSDSSCWLSYLIYWLVSPACGLMIQMMSHDHDTGEQSSHLLKVQRVNRKLLIERPFLLGQQEIGVGVLTEQRLAGLVPSSKAIRFMLRVLDSSDSNCNAVSSILHCLLFQPLLLIPVGQDYILSWMCGRHSMWHSIILLIIWIFIRPKNISYLTHCTFWFLIPSGS